eukprot:scaffold42440_cov122-Amphora_coffeaeformis.AAC.1
MSESSPPPVGESSSPAATATAARAGAGPGTTGTTTSNAAKDSKNNNNNNNNNSNSNKQAPSPMDFEPPLACVRRILKHALPASTNVGKDASAAFARASGIFIIYLTACAHDHAREHKRQTITAPDVSAAMRELDMEEFVPQMDKFLESYRQAERNKKAAKEKALK